MSIDLHSPVFQSGNDIPQKYTGQGENFSPPLEWSDAPEGTKSFAVMVDDPDAPRGVFNHWVLYNLPADQRQLPEHFPRKPSLDDGTRQGKNDFDEIGYAGPAPPPGKPHHYHFRIYALDCALNTSPGAKKEEVLRSMQQHILDQGEMVGLYRAEPK